ncbi:UDP-3-O-(3-hydroxymyristoyl)glucosamine N-acyltransferase [Phreatobacter oligotrophus]|uniref:UDP-3-O-acylglucosamine N-acyltransferase n=1 Tax=Phreatobacter oligotrophus TaxID=1122261 RepID=A0A2T4Z5C1_9HYPH|nr:UDP-3-O-(3-hydroxymyristoyl)glucosamine N-acyltransferase [Phreatobacter oligotrophus]PTM57091.1 UDP-3-O-[3-hydroxymyristoyl] glucosamine N-acyltransferase [Phreatobacter oligotrophus]
MAEPQFLIPAEAMTVASVAAFLKAEWVGGDGERVIRTVAALSNAGPDSLTFLDNPKYAGQLATTRSAACLVHARQRDLVPAEVAAIVVPHPHAAFVSVSRRLYPQALKPQSLFGATGISPGAMIHPTARLESGVVVDPGVVVGPQAEIGSGTVLAAGAVIGPGVRIGRDCAIGPHVSLTHALLGNRVILHAGVRVGQDGFGFELGRQKHAKVPQIGRVIIQDDVEIGANSTVDRGHVLDTVIGEGTKIDNLVQIAHNVEIGRHCVIVSQVGLSGSARLGDFVMLGGQVGVNNHVTVGSGAQIAATSIVKDDVPEGARWGGRPAKPVRDWFREIAAVERLGRARTGEKD